MEYSQVLSCAAILKTTNVIKLTYDRVLYVGYLPSEFDNGELGMFTGADWGWSILDDIPADIELSISYFVAAGKEKR